MMFAFAGTIECVDVNVGKAVYCLESIGELGSIFVRFLSAVTKVRLVRHAPLFREVWPSIEQSNATTTSTTWVNSNSFLSDVCCGQM